MELVQPHLQDTADLISPSLVLKRVYTTHRKCPAFFKEGKSLMNLFDVSVLDLWISETLTGSSKCLIDS